MSYAVHSCTAPGLSSILSSSTLSSPPSPSLRLLDAVAVQAWVTSSCPLPPPSDDGDDDDVDGHGSVAAGTVYLLAPDAMGDSTPHAYTYRASSPVSAWVGDDNAVVFVDVHAAGNVELGRIDAGASAVLREGLLDFPPDKHHGLGAMAATVVSALQYVFVPDIYQGEPEDAAHVLVPVIAFHDEGGSPAPLSARGFDAVKQVVEASLAPWEVGYVTRGDHGLVDHPHIDMAVRKALIARSVMKQDPQTGAINLLTVHALDPNLLRTGLRDASDALAGGLLEHSPYHSLLMAGKGHTTVAHNHTRVVPVYVFSLGLYPDNLLFTDGTRVASFPDAVFVLASGGGTDGSASIPFFDYRSPEMTLQATPENTLRHVLAGLETALIGALPPTLRYSPLHTRTVESFVWSVGGHPHGVFGGSSQDPENTVITTLPGSLKQRGGLVRVLRELDAVVVAFERVVDMIEAFAHDVAYNPGGDDLEHSHSVSRAGERLFIDRLYHFRRSSLLFASSKARETVGFLHDHLAGIEQTLRTLAGEAWGGHLRSLITRVRDLSAELEVFEDQAERRILATRADLECCEFTHHIPGTHRSSHARPSSSSTGGSVMSNLVGNMVIVFVLMGAVVAKAFLHDEQRELSDLDYAQLAAYAAYARAVRQAQQQRAGQGVGTRPTTSWLD